MSKSFLHNGIKQQDFFSPMGEEGKQKYHSSELNFATQHIQPEKTRPMLPWCKQHMQQNSCRVKWMRILSTWLGSNCYNTYVKVNQACIYQIWSFKLTLLQLQNYIHSKKEHFFLQNEIQLQRNYQQKSLEKESSWKNYSSFTKNVTILKTVLNHIWAVLYNSHHQAMSLLNL